MAKSPVSLAQLKENLLKMKSYELPERCISDENNISIHEGDSPIAMSTDEKNSSFEENNKPTESSHSSHRVSNKNSLAKIRMRKSRSDPILDQEIVGRYRNARDAYLRSRMIDLFLEHFGTFDGTSCTFQFPPLPTPEEQDELRLMQEKTETDLKNSIVDVRDSFQSVNAKYELFCHKRDELEKFVIDMENGQKEKHKTSKKDEGRDHNQVDEPSVDMNLMGEEKFHAEEDDKVAHEQLSQQEEKLASMVNKRLELESKLRKIRMETQDIMSNIDKTKNMVKDVMNENNNEEKVDLEDIDNLSTDDVRQRTETLRTKIRDMENMADYYESMRTSLEELGGIRIISVSSASPVLDHEDKDITSASSFVHSRTKQSIDSLENPEYKRNALHRRLSSSPFPSKNSSPSAASLQGTGDFIYLKICLLDIHIVLVRLKSNKSVMLSNQNSKMKEAFKVVDAKLLTSHTLSDSLPNTEEHKDNPTKTISFTIPSLNDLVRLSLSMEPVLDLRFFLRETMARIRTITARVDALAHLRVKYLTKIGPVAGRTNYGNGGEDQEIVCSLNCGVTAVLRLTADCPLLEGSTYIHKLVGIGGWSDEILQKIKMRVNDKKLFTPIEVMDFLSNEISKLESNDIPQTPYIPMKKLNQSKSLNDV